VSRVIACLAVLAALGVVVVGLLGDADHALFAPFFLAGALAPVVVGLLVSLRRPGNVVAWILLVGALSVSVVMLAGVIAEVEGDTPLGRWAATVAAPWPVLFLWPLALAFVFPDGALPSPRWRPVAWAAAVDGAGIVVLLVFGHEHLLGDAESRARCPCGSAIGRCRSSGSSGPGCSPRCSPAPRRCGRGTRRATTCCAARSCGSPTVRC
jgi:hypothetical protein